MPPQTSVRLLVVPYDSARRDTRMGAGPGRLVASGLHERLAASGHDVDVETIEATDGAWRAEVGTAFDLNRRLATSVATAREQGAIPVVLAGNCNTAVGTIAGLGAAGTGVLWFDAHGDFNTPETTEGGFLDGMALAMVNGRCWMRLTESVPGFEPVPADRVILVGASELDDEESFALTASAITLLPIDGTSRVEERAAAAVERLASRVEQLYVHVDLDVLDASEGRANSYAGGPGLTLAELLRTIEIAAARIPIAGAAITAYDPAYDPAGSVCRAGSVVVERIVALASERIAPVRG